MANARLFDSFAYETSEAAPNPIPAKAMLRDLGPVIDAVAIERSVAALMARWESAEAAEGVAAFFDKRRPGWADG